MQQIESALGAFATNRCSPQPESNEIKKSAAKIFKGWTISKIPTKM